MATHKKFVLYSLIWHLDKNLFTAKMFLLIVLFVLGIGLRGVNM